MYAQYDQKKIIYALKTIQGKLKKLNFKSFLLVVNYGC